MQDPNWKRGIVGADCWWLWGGLMMGLIHGIPKSITNCSEFEDIVELLKNFQQQAQNRRIDPRLDLADFRLWCPWPWWWDQESHNRTSPSIHTNPSSDHRCFRWSLQSYWRSPQIWIAPFKRKISRNPIFSGSCRCEWAWGRGCLISQSGNLQFSSPLIKTQWLCGYFLLGASLQIPHWFEWGKFFAQSVHQEDNCHFGRVQQVLENLDGVELLHSWTE